MTNDTDNTTLANYNLAYNATGANNSFRRTRWQVKYLVNKRQDLTEEHAERLITKIMNAVTDAALELCEHEPCKDAMIRLVHILAAWNMLDPFLKDHILEHLANFNLVSNRAPALFTAFATTWTALTELALIRKHLQQLHDAVVEENSVRAAASLRFVEAAQEMAKAVSEMMRPNLSHVESASATTNAQLAAKRITDGLHFLNLD